MFVCFFLLSFYIVCLCFFLFFFFSSRRRHTSFDCDWSSDVCSSDLPRSGHSRSFSARQDPSYPSPLDCLAVVPTASTPRGLAASSWACRCSCKWRIGSGTFAELSDGHSQSSVRDCLTVAMP